MDHIYLTQADFISNSYRGIEDFALPAESERQPLKSDPRITAVPMMLRRRLSDGSRLAAALGMSMLRKAKAQNLAINHVVFASRGGEMDCSIKLLEDMVKDGGLSPAVFSASVHNAGAGAMTVASGYHGTVSAISAADETLFATIAETAASLSEEQKLCSLAVLWEDRIACDDLDFKKLGPDRPYALAMILSSCKASESIRIPLDYAWLSGMDAYAFAKFLASKRH